MSEQELTNAGLTVYSQPLPDRMNYARALSQSGLLPAAYVKHPENVLVAMEYGAALGLPPMQAINSINVIKGKPSASADLLAAMVRRAGHKLRVKGDDTYAEATIIRADDPEYPMTVRWDMQRARLAGLAGNGSWAKYPAAMLRARAISEVARMAANDALYGVIYTPEEIEDTHQTAPAPAPVPVESEVVDAEVVDAEVVPGSTTPAPASPVTDSTFWARPPARRLAQICRERAIMKQTLVDIIAQLTGGKYTTWDAALNMSDAEIEMIADAITNPQGAAASE